MNSNKVFPVPSNPILSPLAAQTYENKEKTAARAKRHKKAQIKALSATPAPNDDPHSTPVHYNKIKWE